MVALAIVGSALIAGAATEDASRRSSHATADAAKAATTAQTNAVNTQSTLSQPYRDLGTGAIPKLQELLGLTPGSDPTKALEATPGYEFAKKQGLDATKANAASMGMALSGNTLESLDQFGTGLAEQAYGNEVSRLENVVGMGQAAAAGQAQNVGNAATNTGNIAMAQGNTLAGIQANQDAAYAKVFGNASNQYVMNNTLQNLNSTPATIPTPVSSDQAWA